MGSHIAAVGDQPGRLLESPLTLQQCVSDRGNLRDRGCPCTRLLGAQLTRDILALQPDSLRAVGIAVESHIQTGRNLRQPSGIIERHSGPFSRQRHKAIQGAAVQEVPTKRVCDASRNGALARAAGAVNGDHRNALLHFCPPASTRISAPVDAMQAEKPGNEVSTASTSRMSTSPSAIVAATASDIATRWSP